VLRVAHSDDKKRARLNVISHLLDRIPYRPLRAKKVTLPERRIREDRPPRGRPIPMPY